jgi:hypothetical protein
MGPFDILAGQHRDLENRLAALESAGESGTRRERLGELAAALGGHARLEEETGVFPRLASCLGPEEREALLQGLLTLRAECVPGADAVSGSDRLAGAPRRDI